DRLRPQGRDHCQSDPAIPCGGDSGDLPDHLFPRTVPDGPALLRVRELTLRKLKKEETMLKTALKSLVLATLLAGTAGAALAQEIMLRATANSNEQDEDYDGLVVFKNYVENASNGAIGVEIFMGTQLCAKGDECLAGVADGTIDIYISTSGGAAGLFPYIQVLDLPYLMSDDRVAEEVLTGTDFTAKLRTMALADSGDKI